MTNKICRVGLDAMGGDHAPEAMVEGAILAIDEYKEIIHISLVGIEDEIKKYLPKSSSYDDYLSVVHASQVVEMDDSPLVALREKKDSSISVLTSLLKENKVDAITSSGNTGAYMASSLFSVGKIDGVTRPTIGTFYPRIKGEGFLLDVGANTDCKPQHLLQFGIMGATYVKLAGIENPKVGLLNVGEEESKGNELTKEAYKLFKSSNLNFIGNVEGRDLLTDKADVVVCDGFVGNTLLKMFETFGDFFESLFDGEEKNEQNAKAIHAIMERVNYENHGGIPLLGLNGISVIGHGHSSPSAVKNAVYMAYDMFKKELNIKIRQTIDKI